MKLGSLQIGEGRPVAFVADIGLNHDGNLDLARETIDSAARAGADAVKLQSGREGLTAHPFRCEADPACELSDATMQELARHAAQAGVAFLGVTRDAAGVDAQVRAGAPALAIGHGFFTALPLIEHVARSKRPLLISVGAAGLSEIEAAVTAFRRGGGSDLVVLLGSPALPSVGRELNLRRLVAVRETLGCAVGFSDHSEGEQAAGLAVALGAIVIEKRFTLNRALPAPGHRLACDHGQFAALVRGVHDVESMLGARLVKPVAATPAQPVEFRVSCAAAVELPVGHLVRGADIKFVRTGNGVPPQDVASLVGRPLARAMQAGEAFTVAHFAAAA